MDKKTALLEGLQKMRENTRRTLGALDRASTVKLQNTQGPGGGEITFTLNQVRKMPGLTQPRADNAVASLKSKGRDFPRDETKVPSPYNFSLADVRAIYREAGILSHKERLQELGLNSRAKVIAATNLKGGVGKSTTVATLASGMIHSRSLISHQLRVLIIDMDPQGSTSVAFGFKGLGFSEQHSAVEAISKTIDPETLKTWIKPTQSCGLDILPGSTGDAFFSLNIYKFASSVGVNVTELLQTYVIEPLRDAYDVILIDCGPHFDAIVLNVMQAADALLVPVGLDPLEFDSMLKYIERLVDLYETIPHPNLDINQIKFLAVKHNFSNAIHTDNFQLLQRTYPGHVFSQKIEDLRPFAAVFDDNKTVYTMQPKFYSGDVRSLKKAQQVADQVVTDLVSIMLHGEQNCG